MKVVEGKKGWLFLDNDTNQVNKQIMGRLLFSEKQLLQWKLLLEMRSLWLKEQGISYFFMVVPNKACVYSEFLPDHIKLSSERNVTQLVDHISKNSFVKFIYPLPELLDAKQRMLTYPQTDTHWSDFGAFVGYKALMSEISKTHKLFVLNEEDIEFFEQPVMVSDLGSKLGISVGETIRAKLLSPEAKCILDNKIFNTGRLMIFESRNNNLPKAVIFRDSFSSQLLKFLAESFSRLVAVWQPNIDYSIILNEKPDIVISQQVERFLIHLPDDLKGLSNEDYVRQKEQETSPG